MQVAMPKQIWLGAQSQLVSPGGQATPPVLVPVPVVSAAVLVPVVSAAVLVPVLVSAAVLELLSGPVLVAGAVVPGPVLVDGSVVPVLVVPVVGSLVGVTVVGALLVERSPVPVSVLVLELAEVTPTSSAHAASGAERSARVARRRR